MRQDPSREPVETLLTRAADGDNAAARHFLPVLYDELHALACKYMANERDGHTLQPTALVHEAYLRLAGERRRWTSGPHFFAAAALAMRRVLVDHARRRLADKRGGGATRVALRDGMGRPGRDVQVLELDDLLDRLAQLDARRARVVELRFFAGMTHEQIATAIGVARSTVAEDWTVARAWLASRLGPEGAA